MVNRPGRVTFAVDLHAHGDRLAIVGPDDVRLTYRQLAQRVSETAARLGPGRRLVLVAASNAVEPIVAYLAALSAGHVVLLAGADDGLVDTLVAHYDPDVLCRVGADGRWQVVERREGTAHDLHPELAVLLCTSGSTGCPKLVRLSATNLVANAEAIADYLDIRDTDRATLTLPVHYCYGLSVVNSNLTRGAALLLSDRSVADPAFWAAFREHGGTSLHGVPYTFELLDRIGFPQMRLPGLRYVTQAGGRLPPATVRRYAELGRRNGWDFFVMYGQTEATARMAYLPPELAARHPSAIGRPIPGGSFTIEPVDGHDADVGELVYRGPNVMLGYAHERADLARGRTVEVLRTGDLARHGPDGLYEIVGRRSRFIKPFGLRIDLDHVERLLADEGCTAACAGNDAGLVVVAAHDPDEERLRHFLAERLGLPAAHIRVVAVDELPRRGNGKIDYQAVAALGRSRRKPLLGWAPVPRPRRRMRSVHDAFRSVFPVQDLPAHATFVGLGGDSLSYVQMTVALQRVLGYLPDGWPTMPIERLAALPTRRRYWAMMETTVVLRAAAIILVVGSHVGLFRLLGGAHVLLAVAGWAFARFVLSTDGPAGPSGSILRSAARIAVPTSLWIGWRSLVQDDVHPRNALLLNSVIDPATWGYWYVETLCQVLVLLAAVFAIPAVRRFERAAPFWFALVALLVALVGRLFPDPGNEFSDRLMSTHLVLWIFVLGWLAFRATTAGQKVVMAGLVLLLVPEFFGEPVREAILIGGLLLLLVPRVPVPWFAVRPLGAVAAASLAIYLTHYAVYPELLAHLPPLATVAACIAVGVVAMWLVDLVVRGWRRALPEPGRSREHSTVTPTSVGTAPAGRH